MQMTVKPDSDRFESGAEKYAAYLETPEGACGATWLSPTCRIFCPWRGPRRYAGWISGAARERPPSAWRALAFT
ncbi:MAG: hypothetical protein PVSMB1_19120 [Gemmatimonadaceae bacterium]